MLRWSAVLLSAWIVFLSTAAQGGEPSRCNGLPRSELQTQIAQGLLQISLQQQGKIEYRDNGGATGLEMRRAMQVAEDQLAMRQGRAAGGDVAFLFVKSGGPKDSPAIALTPTTGRGLSCFVRSGDAVLLRDGPSAHWTTVYSVDLTADVFHFVDPWPMKFPFLSSNSAGDWNAKLQPEGVGSVIAILGDEVEKLLFAVVTIDEAALATRLVGASCRCATGDVAVRAIYDTLLGHSRAVDLGVAANLADSLGPSRETEIAKAYDAAAIFLAGTAGVNVGNAATDRFVALVERRRYESFKELSPHVLVKMYEQTRSRKDSLDNFIKSAVTKASINTEFTGLEYARVRIQTGRLYDAEGDVGAAIDEVKFVVTQLADLYSAALKAVQNDANSMGWRRGVNESYALETFKVFIDARAYAISLYSRNKNLKAAGHHFGELLAVDAPFPPQILVGAAAAGCHADGKPDRVAALGQLDLKTPEAKAEIIKLACFP